MVSITKNPKAYFTEEINISPEYLIKCYIEDYGKDGEKLYTKGEKLTHDKYHKGKYICKVSMRLFCRDCHYYEKCKGVKWNKGCKYQKEFLRIIKKYKEEE